MRRALDTILDSAGSTHLHITRPSKDVLDAVVRASQGDIRSAINALELVCSAPSDTKPSKGRKKTSRAMLEIVTRKENSLMLFHLLGKVLYNKRWFIAISQLPSLTRGHDSL
jgi:cell cycle checkpoint protein